MFEDTLPSLPPLFGNPLLRGELQEIASPGPIDWLPQTLGWQILALILALWTLRRCWRLFRSWLRNRYRREAQRRLLRLGPSGNATAINEVLKLTAMTASSRREVAALTGRSWCDWLQARTPALIFSKSSLQLLGDALYNPQSDMTSVQRTALIQQASLWIDQHKDDHEFS